MTPSQRRAPNREIESGFFFSRSPALATRESSILLLPLHGLIEALEKLLPPEK